MKKSFKELIRKNKEENKKFIGTFAHLPCEDTLEILGYAGFDFAIIDMEHSPIAKEESIRYIRAVETSEMIPMVRVPDVNDETAIRKVLDNGAAGVVIPGISTADMARQAVKYSKFFPEGKRGACPLVRANKYYVNGTDGHFERSNKEVSIMLMVEGKEGIENFDEIVNVQGVDAVLFGPVDMSVSLGHAGDVNHPEVTEAITRLIKKANAAGVCVGMTAFAAEDTGKWIDARADFILVGCDILLYAEAVKAAVKTARGQMKGA